MEFNQQRAGLSIREWCKALGLGRSTFYVLPAKPRFVKIGRRVIVSEPPAAWLKRMGGGE